MATSPVPSDKIASRKSDQLKRHLDRNLSFDLNRSTPQVREKYKRVNQCDRMATRPPQIEDRSGTINVPTTNQGAVPKNKNQRNYNYRQNQQEDEVFPVIKNMVAESMGALKANMDQTMESLINEKLSKELTKVNENMAQLAEMVRTLACTGRMNQASNNWQYERAQNQAPNVGNVFTHDTDNVGLRTDAWRIRVDKLGIEFNGSQGGRDQLSVEDFVFRLEHMQRQYQIPWDEILRDFHLLVSGPVKQWYWALLQTTIISDWSTLRMALLNRYKAVRSNWELMQELVERKQQPGESIDDYFHSLNILRAKLEVPVAEGEMIRIAKRNLRDGISRIVYPMAVSSVEHLRMECLEAERTFARRDYRNVQQQQMRPTRSVNEVFITEIEDEEENYKEVAALDNEPTCWNCKQKGHYFKECMSQKRSLFCYKCGKPNTITPNCPKCIQAMGNTKRDAVSSGESRPSVNAPKNN